MMILYSYWRSLAAYRVRIALHIKGIPYEVKSMDLIQGDQFNIDYRKINPQMVVPTLVDGENILTQSMAILEYIEELHPNPCLLPNDPIGRSRVRAISLISVADTHPLVIPRIRKYITQNLAHDEATLETWISNWLTKGLEAIEENLDRSKETGTYCHGDSVTFADICVVPQFGAARLFGINTEPYPRIANIFDTCMKIPAFFDSRPQVQPDFPKGT